MWAGCWFLLPVQGCSSMLASSSCSQLGIQTGSSIQPHGLALKGPVLVLRNKTPREFVGAGDTGISAGAADKCPGDLVILGGTLSSKFAVSLVAVLVGPDSPPYEAGRTIVEHDRLRAETDPRPRPTAKH